jgi:hypothetical protein
MGPVCPFAMTVCHNRIAAGASSSSNPDRDAPRPGRSIANELHDGKKKSETRCEIGTRARAVIDVPMGRDNNVLITKGRALEVADINLSFNVKAVSSVPTPAETH